MGGTPQGPAGLPPTGQPLAMQPGEFQAAARTPQLFGQGERAMRGTPRVISIAKPPVAFDFVYAHSGPSWFLFKHMMAQLNTSAAVANRQVRIQLLHNGILCGQWDAGAVQAAGLNTVYSISNASLGGSDTSTINVCLPTEFILRDGMTLQSSTLLMQGGDNWTPIAFEVEEFTDACMDLL